MPKEDLELSSRDVLGLSSRDALAAFFARLGYDTNLRVVQNPAAMGLSNDNLKLAITHIERLASQDGGLFEVYLFELKTLTSANRRDIVKTFRNRPGDYMLLMTDDYSRLDFVLVERFNEPNPTQGKSGTGPLVVKQVGVRPRLLSVDRRNPDSVALRVLRRFTYTESDTFAQYDKFISAYDVADWSEPFFNNRALFSDYYLTKRLPETEEWSSKNEAALLTKAFKQLRDRYADARENFSGKNEAFIRQHLLEPVLETLGFAPQSGKPSDSSALEPDYRLFAPVDNSKPLALCLVYTWGRNLDGKDEQRDNQTPDENPGAAVVTLLDLAEAEWAIVTNGKLWRLYSAKAHSRATNYYELDLEETLAYPPAGLEEAFRYFWLMFRAAAFVKGTVTPANPNPLCFLDNLLTESDKYARELGERLKERVFEQIFPHFARGFITYALRQQLLPANLDTLPQDERRHLLEPFFAGTLTFLYRLLFLHYAEARDLLPVREVRGYYEKSLEKLKAEVAVKAGDIQDLAPAKLKLAYTDISTELYDRLQLLFTAVDRGDTALNVPTYNGGLFVTQPDPSDLSPEAAVARFLATYRLPDRELALGLDLMARDLDDKTKALAMIDYKSLGVRQLGSIYEGLLEFKLRVASEEMALVNGKKTEEIVPYSEAKQKKLPILKAGRGKDAPDRTLPKGSVYLENDRRERKATGSYYTPDYIVKYIVENTVGPVLQEKLEGLRPAFREAERTLQQEKKNYQANKNLGRTADSYENQTYLKFREKVNEPFFDLKVLDPAMGSGHFLVEAVDFITDRLADYLNAFPWNPVQYELQKTRQEIQQEMERQGISLDSGKLTDLNLLKRRVLKSCIYGVDLNPMAVELAKVSLWLDCFTLGAPLSFLDHHLKCGNSLIGGNLKEVQDALSRDLFGNQFAGLLSATHLMRRVGELSDVTAQEVAESRQSYKGAYDALAPFKRLLDVWISEHFGNKGAQRTTSLYAGAIVANDYRTTNTVDKKAIETALALSAGKRFFHWELEFPEVFYSEHERKPDGGFDAVVGNPPYVRQEGLGEDKKAFQTTFQVFNSIADLYTYFIERGHVLLGAKGRFGMITANKFMRANYGAALRSFLTNKVKLEKLIDFGELRVFGDAATDPIILLSVKTPDKKIEIEYLLLKDLNFDNLSRLVKELAIKMPESAFSDSNWSLAATSSQSVLDKLKTNSVTLGQYVDGTIRRGILTGYNEAFFIDRITRDKLVSEDPQSAEVIKPLIVGDDVRRYYLDAKQQYLIFTRRGINISNYKTIEKYLAQYRNLLEPKPQIWNSKTQGEWQGRKPGPYKWYEIQDNVAYYPEFEKPKIIYPVIAMINRFMLDSEGYYSNDKTFIIPKDDKYLIAVLNSSLIWAYLKTICSVFGDADNGGRLELRSVYLETIPIHRIAFTTIEAERAWLVEELKGLYSGGLGE